MPDYTEDHLVEQPALAIMQDELGWVHVNGFHETFGEGGTLGRSGKHEVVLVSRLRAALRKQNPNLPESGIDQAVDELTRDRSAMSLVEANREIYDLIKNGVKVKVPDPDTGRQDTKVVKVIDWLDPANNDYFIASQFWISGALYTKRPDVIAFVNGLPLVLMEFKKPGVHVREGFDKNICDYKDTIPQLFHYNGLILISNGTENKLGSLTAPWEFYSDWKKVSSEDETPKTSLENLLRGTCEPSRLLDLIENYTLFSENKGEVSKLVARNHQLLGVNGLIESLVRCVGLSDSGILGNSANPHPQPLSQRERGVGKATSQLLSQREKKPHYRGGFNFSGLVERARELRREQTPAEEILWELLRNRQFMGLKFRRQHQIGNYITDFFCAEHQLIIEADGDVHQTEHKSKHDRVRDQGLITQGFKIVRIPNELILDNPQVALEQIAAKLPSPSKSPSPSGRGGGEGNTPRPRSGLGVFWHTQGSGKSYSMVFFAEKVFRKIPGNWTFVIITDRTELDIQIYKTFARCGAAREQHCHASSSAKLRDLLREDHRYVFTLIHKFRTEPGEAHPVLSERDDIIVLTDEAHRSQYDTLAMNMRTALPNAKFVAFTGTPLISGEERTREVFGDYVSIYDFKSSVDDGATVPLFYENRTPELEITNPDLNDEIYDVIEEAGLDEDQEEKLEKVLGKKYHLITRDDRLDTVARDIVHHFLNRGYQGKAMVVCIDKLTAVKMHAKVAAEWQAETERVSEELAGMAPRYKDYAALNERLRNLQETGMAVVVSPEQNEIATMAKHDLDMQVHRERMVKEKMDDKFKDPDDVFRLVFVCSMWLTGFDVPNCSTLYLDKPMRGHTLMQTIARANRVYGDKVNGLIVDYANVFQELEKALAIYGSGTGGGEMPVKDKAELVEALKIALNQVTKYCADQGIALQLVMDDSAKHFLPALNRLLRTDEVKENFLGQAKDIARLYKAVMPDPIIPDLAPRCQVVQELAKAIRATKNPVDITEVLQSITQKLDGSIVAEPHIAPGEEAKTIDLSQIDFEALEQKFSKTNTKNTETQKLRALIERKLDNMIRLNASRYDYLEQFQKMVEDYNSGALGIEQLFEQLVIFSKQLNEEEQRHIRENISEEELAVFDILTRPGPDLDGKEIELIKRVCRDMLAKLKTEKLVLDWRKRRTTRAAVRISIEEMLDSGLPEKYTVELFEQKCGALFQHMLEKYPQRDVGVYSEEVA
ncbi:MAG: HsdR family type I site-specific deoxyribonuclease [Verrucomicrobiales bacterium]|nr:HsdR family type I site-specific deoxyribonuclease [Verrucomicrobiales bacterium]